MNSHRLIHVATDPTEVLILEDAFTNDFVRSTNSDGLDMQHSLVAIEKLATLHASSAIYFAKVCFVTQSMPFVLTTIVITGTRRIAGTVWSGFAAHRITRRS